MHYAGELGVVRQVAARTGAHTDLHERVVALRMQPALEERFVKLTADVSTPDVKSSIDLEDKPATMSVCQTMRRYLSTRQPRQCSVLDYPSHTQTIFIINIIDCAS